jgi:glucose/arabinose dehydrogenase
MPRHLPLVTALVAIGFIGACDRGSAAGAPDAASATSAAADKLPFAIAEVATFDEPWALAPLPDGRMLVTEKKGHLQLVDAGGHKREVSGVPAISYGGQGGLGDVALHPRFADNHQVYLSYVEAGEGKLRGAAVARGKLVEDAAGARLEGVQVIWRQVPKIDGGGHFGHRLLFGKDGKLWISSGERQQFDPAQDMGSNLGKVLRLEDDGRVPADNPFAAQGGVAAQVWTLGHRNPLGLAFDPSGQLWELEMGPAGGDELNRIERGANYGWPRVSEGKHYDGREIPPHSSNPAYKAPAISWTPVIAPGDFIIYTGKQFPAWKGEAIVAGMVSQGLVRVKLEGAKAREVARYPMGHRIREVDQANDGALLLLEDGAGARLLKLTGAAAK